MKPTSLLSRALLLALALCASYAAALVAVTRLNALGNATYLRALGEGGLPALVGTVLGSDFLLTALVGGVLAAPYFAFGLYVGLFFAAAPAGAYSRLYFFDLLGAALGCVLFVAAMEASGFRATLVALLAASLAGAFCIRATRSAGFVAASAALQAVAQFVPPARRLLSLTPLGLADVLAIAGVAAGATVANDIIGFLLRDGGAPRGPPML